jgi:molybdopterin molybdotransferase
MITFEEAYDIVMKYAELVQEEKVGMQESLGRVLSEDIRSDMDMPPFDKSAVDGFACRVIDLGRDLEIIETIPAGKLPAFAIGEGKCSRIMTGAMLPEASDCVVMVEDTEILGNGFVRIRGEQESKNICFKGKDIKDGELVLSAGTLIRAPHIAVLAATGKVFPHVYKKIRVGIMSTGDELVEPMHIPAPSKIRNTNAYQLIAQVAEAGAHANYEGIAQDTESYLSAMMTDALDRNDVVLLTGGVSMGEFDYVPRVMERLGIEILFKSVAIQPGRPTVFGRRGEQFIFGLPGNPVSSFVLFEILVKPFLQKKMGHYKKPEFLQLPLGTAITRTNKLRKSLIPVRIENGMVFPVEYHGSAHINAYTKAQGLITFEIGETIFEKGVIKNVRPI